MTTPWTPEATVAVLTIASGRHTHLLGQVGGLSLGTRPPDLHVVVAMGDDELRRRRVPIFTDRWQTITAGMPVGRRGLPLAAARNEAARLAVEQGADVLIWLDVDCVPSRSLVQRYTEVVIEGDRPSPALWCGDVGYLPPAPPTGYPLQRLAEIAEHHPARPPLPVGRTIPEERFELFWSLSFAMAADDFLRVGGFCEDYTGYGGEDTDFAQVVQAAGGSLTWVGGATAYHQHHDSTAPPVDHREAIVRNANLFHGRWGWWPMDGWLSAFAERGLARRAGEGPDAPWELVG